MGIVNALRDLLVNKIDPAIGALYHTCVTTARQPVFYARYGVPDTVDGRFDLIVLHVVLVMLRMQDADARQELFDLMFADMDRSLREMGVGDMGMARKMKPMLAGFYGRARSYQAALDQANDNDLIQTLSRNLYGMPVGQAEYATVLAHYARAARAALDSQSDDDLAEGRLQFPTLLA